MTTKYRPDQESHMAKAAGKGAAMLGRGYTPSPFTPKFGRRSKYTNQIETPRPMKNEIDELQIYRTLIPATRHAYDVTRRHSQDEAHKRAAEFYEELIESLSESILYDCRRLPLGFLEDTGVAYMHELVETKGSLILPHNFCYFEFPDNNFGCAWMGFASNETPVLPEYVEPVPAPPQGCVLYYGWAYQYGASISAIGQTMFPRAGLIFNVHDSHIPFDPAYTTEDEAPIVVATPYMKFLIAGVVALLNETYVLKTFKKDPKPYINKKRIKKGEPPISGDVYLLRVNVPKVRYEASKYTPLGGTHATPVLHWRKGHRRALPPLHGSNVPRSTWVRRHLVGDPAKGFIQPKGYQLRYKEPPPGAQRVA